MIVLDTFPPNYERLCAAFDIRDRDIIFSYGNVIYNPKGGTITPELMVHEEVHGGRQQAMGVDNWWDKYIADPEFRLNEELPAHRAEFRLYCANHRDRNARARYLMQIAQRLAGPIYGGCVTYTQAKLLIGP